MKLIEQFGKVLSDFLCKSVVTLTVIIHKYFLLMAVLFLVLVLQYREDHII